MALWANSKLFVFCILFITFCCTKSRAEMAIDCCLSVSQRKIEKGRIVDYQDQPQGCSMAATILVTRTGRKLCAPVNEEWVRHVRIHVDKLRKHCKKNYYKGKHCSGVKPE